VIIRVLRSLAIRNVMKTPLPDEPRPPPGVADGACVVQKFPEATLAALGESLCVRSWPLPGSHILGRLNSLRHYANLRAEWNSCREVTGP
jgi:hypothetical protein